VINRNYSLCDFPIPLFFPRLDQLYPNSKFIFTTRTTESFIKSVRNHLVISPKEQARRKQARKRNRKNGAKMGSVIHHHAYGRPGFDAAAFARRFEFHKQEVNTYFSDRPDDLLTIDISTPEPDADRWARICDFIGVSDIPTTPYPRAFVTKTRLANLGESLR